MTTLPSSEASQSVVHNRLATPEGVVGEAEGSLQTQAMEVLKPLSAELNTSKNVTLLMNKNVILLMNSSVELFRKMSAAL